MKELREESKKFLKRNEEIIKKNDWSFFKSALYSDVTLNSRREILDLFEELDLNLDELASLKIGDKVIIIKPGYEYDSYSEFFDKNKFPKEWKFKFESNKPELEYGDVLEIIGKGKHGDWSDTLIYVLESPSKDIYLIGDLGVRKQILK